mmetsp:Transcript_2204/g.5093  ORF Transcript_2204/g.5093 Transcript_2204/m.5093 type:complete len:213 (+) Transcript_2204:551-1189(+)
MQKGLPAPGLRLAQPRPLLTPVALHLGLWGASAKPARLRRGFQDTLQTKWALFRRFLSQRSPLSPHPENPDRSIGIAALLPDPIRRTAPSEYRGRNTAPDFQRQTTGLEPVQKRSSTLVLVPSAPHLHWSHSQQVLVAQAASQLLLLAVVGRARRALKALQALESVFEALAVQPLQPAWMAHPAPAIGARPNVSASCWLVLGLPCPPGQADC